ncbi:cholesterol oxidase [Geomonas sp. Red276]
MPSYDFDFIVIGSGFGGSVSAHRLTEKGYRVGVLEMGKRWRPEDFPHSNWNLPRYLWLPRLGCHGSFRMTLFRHVFVLSGAAVGGGSLNYANVLLVPSERVWTDPLWGGLKKWSEVMPAHYATAKRMLGVTRNKSLAAADEQLRQAAGSQGVGQTFYPTDVAIHFGTKGASEPDPFFGGAGPERTGCELCGGCMVGCRSGGKNTLDKNYLYFAEKGGAVVIPETMVTSVTPLGSSGDGSGGYEIRAVNSTGGPLKKERIFRSKGVVFSGGVLGTVPLLMAMREKGNLPKLSPALGEVVRTNSESIIGVRMPGKAGDMSEGVAIGSGIYVDDHTHIEATRYPAGSDALGLLMTLLAGGTPGLGRIVRWALSSLARPWSFLKAANPVGMARSTLILLVMQDHDSRIKLRLKRSLIPPFRKTAATEGAPIPAFIPQANTFAERMANEAGGVPVTSLTEMFFKVPTTAHILGGATMGKNAGEGVVDGEQRVFNYRNMYVCDGSVVSANLGVNPSLTITALAEHAMSHIKPAAETDWRAIGTPVS